MSNRISPKPQTFRIDNRWLFAAVLTPVILSTGISPKTFAAGLYRDGVDARSMSLGGITVADAYNPLSALYGNPGALSELQKTELTLSGTGALLHGEFSNHANRDSTLNTQGVLGSAALAVPVGPFRFALGFNPDMALKAGWRYHDTPGGADGATTYGLRGHDSEISLLRTQFGASWQIIPQLSVGAGIGLLYNQNRLNAPYVFQQQPVLRTVKTLLDLNTEGYGYNFQVGVEFKPVKPVHIGVSYTSGSRIESSGHASGNANVQLRNLGLGAARSDFDYDAKVTNNFPQQVAAGVAVDVTSKLRVLVEEDWINWADSFDRLEVKLRNGSNADLNGLVGSSGMNDYVPLRWRDQYVTRLGAEYAVNDNWTVRAGYSYANNPVPDNTVTPLTAAIMEHTVSAGVGYRKDWFGVDLAYQWMLPATVHTGTSILASGEYSNSNLTVSAQTLNLTVNLQF
ncbi:MAG: outer membrane protein transport protein [Chthoniobacteraceae bacterium]